MIAGFISWLAVILAENMNARCETVWRITCEEHCAVLERQKEDCQYRYQYLHARDLFPRETCIH